MVSTGCNRIVLMKLHLLTRLLAACLLITSPVVLAAPHAEETYQGVKAIDTSDYEPGETILGQRYDYPRGRPLISSHLVEIPPGESTDWHYHSIPVVVYVVTGDLRIDYGPEGTRTFKTGDSYIEAINTCHSATALGTQPAKVYAVFLSRQRGDQTKPSSCDKPE